MRRLFFSTVIGLCFGLLLPALSHANGPVWELYTNWAKVGISPEGHEHWVARDSVMAAPQEPHMVSFYLKVHFANEQQEMGRIYDTEIADMVMDCSHGRMDTLTVYRYFQGIPADNIRFHKERSVKVKLDTLSEQELRMVCGKNLPRFVAEKDRVKERGAILH